MSTPLTDRTRLLITRIPDPTLRAKVAGLLQEDCALYGPPTIEVLERVRFAVIKLAMQGANMFDIAAQLFRSDTRDLLVNAEFADDVRPREMV